MNIISRLSCLILLSCFYSCKCDSKHHCSILSADAQQWMAFNLNDSVKFVNDQGNHFRLAVNTKTLSPEYDARSCKGSWPCSCDERCEASGNVSINGDSAVIMIKVNEGSDFGHLADFSVTYSLLGFSHTITPGTPIAVTVYDSILPSVSLGSHTYQDVFLNATDTTQTYNQNAKVWKAYYTKTMGVIGFIYRPSQTVYYRE